MGHLHYKGYTGSVEYDDDGKYFTGEVLGLRRDGIIYEGDSVESLTKDFQEGIDHYLEHCKDKNVEPEKPFSGKLIIRISPEEHGSAAEKAADKGISLNEFIRRAIVAAL